MISRNGKFSGKILRKIFRTGKFSTSHHYAYSNSDFPTPTRILADATAEVTRNQYIELKYVA
jgi:hypothetical protein